jgi:hypothetical protein
MPRIREQKRVEKYLYTGYLFCFKGLEPLPTVWGYLVGTSHAELKAAVDQWIEARSAQIQSESHQPISINTFTGWTKLSIFSQVPDLTKAESILSFFEPQARTSTRTRDPAFAFFEDQMSGFDVDS